MDLMHIQYDEDLSQNSFFKKLQTEHKIILDTAPLENWIICIPRTATIRPEDLTNPNFLLAHILIPNDELPSTHYTNLLGNDITLINKQLTNNLDIESTVLFEEVFYTKGLMRYKVWCIETPLQPNANKSKRTNGIFVCRDLKDSIQMIWNETKSNAVLRRIDNACTAFIVHHRLSDERKNLPKLRQSIELLYEHCLQHLLCVKRLKENCRVDVHFYKILKIALETYMMNCLYEFLFDAITVSYLEDSEQLNRTIRNLSDAHLSQFNIDNKHNDVLTCMRVELLKIQDYTTGIEKLSMTRHTTWSPITIVCRVINGFVFSDCIRRALNAASRSKHSNLSVDELIPILVFVIIKSSLTHWVPTLIFLKEFVFNDLTDVYDDGANSFLVTTLEAAIVYIKSYTNPAGHKEAKLTDKANSGYPLKFKTKDHFMDYVSEQICLENESEILRLLKTGTATVNIGDDRQQLLAADETERYTSDSHLCHPLCDCRSCDRRQNADNQPNVNTQNRYGVAALHLAAKFGQATILNLVLALEANTRLVDENNWTALHYAAAKGHQNTLLLLLHAGIDINAKTSDKCTALHLSSLNGHQGCVKALLYYADHMKSKIDVNCQNKMGDTALHLAAKWGFTEIVETLLEYGINVDSRNRLGHTAIHYSHNSYITKLMQNSYVVIHDDACSMNEMELVTGVTMDRNIQAALPPPPLLSNPEPFRGYIRAELIHSSSATMPKRTTNEKVIKALRSGDTKLAYYFLGIESEFVPPPSDSASQCHPLCVCELCQIVTPDSSENFQNLCIDVNETNSAGVTLIHAAAQIGDVFLMKFLIDQGATVNCRTIDDKQTPLHAAIVSKSIEATKLIMSLIGEELLNAQDCNGSTALHLAVKSGDCKMVECLLEHEPMLELKNYRQQTAMGIAEENLFFNIGTLLEAAANANQ